MKTFAWVSFWLVAAIWGSSFLLIRVGVEHFTPGQIAVIRCVIAAIGLNAVMLARGKRYPRDLGVWIAFAIVGFGNAALPYWLIGLGERTIESALASVIQSTVPMFSLVIAHFALADERVNTQKILGLLMGFIGVTVLALRQTGSGHENALGGMLMVVGASLCYAILTVYTRRRLSNNIEPIVIAGSTFILSVPAALALMLLEPVLGVQVAADVGPMSGEAIGSVLVLGLLNTFIAYLFFYYIIRELGAFRATNVTYVVPVFGVVLGALVLREQIDIALVAGAGLILSGIAVINLGGRLATWVRPRSRPATVA
ncbi:MAG: DMT family transporter [Chloroflexi bacterium]|nr:DMT family transporter [Chloroflexota bacterium]